MAVPYTFGTATSSIPLSQLDSNFNTVITLGNTAIQLGNTVTTLNNMTLANVTISSGNVTITNVAITTANVTTANITTAVIGTETVTTSTITTANVTTANITTDNITNGTVITSLTLSYGTANGVTYLNGSKVLTSGSAFVFDGTNVGIGGSPTWALDIQTSAANIRVAPAVGTNNSLTRYVNTGGTGYVGLDNSVGGLTTAYALNLYHSGAYPIVFSNSGAERMRIDSSGRVGINKIAPTSTLDINGTVAVATSTAAGAGYGIQVTQASGADRDVFLAGVLSVSNGFQVQYVSSAMKYTMTGLGTGTVTSTGGVLSAVSDQNMKVADGEIENAIDKVLALKPRYFYWKDKDGNADISKRRQLGFYAQEVNAVVPEASPAPIVESDGWGVYDRSLVATLVKAMQEQQALITSLTARIEALER